MNDSLRPIRFEDSLAALAQIALKETAAIGYGLFQRIAAAPGMTRIASMGEEIQASDLLQDTEGAVHAALLIVLPLHTDGLAAFYFADSDTLRAAKEPLRRIAEAMATIWAARHSDSHYLTLARRVSALESQLIDSKIVSRAHGLLSAPEPSDALNSLVSHVQTVFRPGSAARSMETIAKELEDEIESRRVTAQAKEILQSSHALSEEEAYAHLRALSRKSRRRLKEVAADVMAQHTLKAQTT